MCYDLYIQAPSRLELTADFHRLNLLLMTVEQSDEIQIGRKVATATLSQARIQATLGIIRLCNCFH